MNDNVTNQINQEQLERTALSALLLSLVAPLPFGWWTIPKRDRTVLLRKNVISRAIAINQTFINKYKTQIDIIKSIATELGQTLNI
jgi:hypothetical protein